MNQLQSDQSVINTTINSKNYNSRNYSTINHTINSVISNNYSVINNLEKPHKTNNSNKSISPSNNKKNFQSFEDQEKLDNPYPYINQELNKQILKQQL